MKGDHIKYREGYKYQLAETYMVYIGIVLPRPVDTEWLILENGWLTIKRGYAWDGPSGPTIDTPDSMRAALIHDALYQLMRLGLLDISYRPQVDDLLHEICVEDGMVHIRAELWEEAVSHFAAAAARSDNEPPVLIAPRPGGSAQWTTDVDWRQTVGGP